MVKKHWKQESSKGKTDAMRRSDLTVFTELELCNQSFGGNNFKSSSHCTRNSKVVPVAQHTNTQYRSASNNLLARTADRSPKRDSKDFRTPRRSLSINIHSRIQAHSLYSLPRQAVTSHGII
ncbi:hypothetical protein AVEN_5844-1 [Araneus ventricosus]|uniref:Uncharacterized protein n=1 Tax=Araneus ventricosus TaxID=182803 RepID=A0A4Y2S788_ARAVE|nr:hypothetical protein AVEN_5844-1 [Araneus ventricosus]